MNITITIKSLLLIIFVYFGLILNNSLGQYFSDNNLISVILLCFILTELASYGYKFLFSNSPGLLFYLFSFILSFYFILRFSFFLENFIIFLSIAVYNIVLSFLSLFFPFEDQLQSVKKELTETCNDYVLRTKEGLILNEYTIIFDHSFSFMTYSDKQNFFDILKNQFGVISYCDDVSVHFSLKTKGIKYISFFKNILIKNGEDINKLLLNLLIK